MNARRQIVKSTRLPAFYLSLAFLFASCVSLTDRQLTLQEKAEFGSVGTVSAQFTTFRWFHGTGAAGIKNKAYTQLLAEA